MGNGVPGSIIWSIKEYWMAAWLGKMIEKIETKPTQLTEHDSELWRKSYGAGFRHSKECLRSSLRVANLTNRTSLLACIGPSTGVKAQTLALVIRVRYLRACNDGATLHEWVEAMCVHYQTSHGFNIAPLCRGISKRGLGNTNNNSTFVQVLSTRIGSRAFACPSVPFKRSSMLDGLGCKSSPWCLVGMAIRHGLARYGHIPYGQRGLLMVAGDFPWLRADG
ncbi:hypothetical protein ACH5RR_002766 [Cinchona calisaya]|uniref:Uncharacterized protein n=1 Tax=Cinchona calisaya TaxID=153742 RepID=A0ABD3ASZ8_9GENT